MGDDLFRGLFYLADDAMLWAADLLYLLQARDGQLAARGEAGREIRTQLV